MNTRCPHCQKELEILSASEIKQRYCMTDHQIFHARRTGAFPEPWIPVERGGLFLAADVERYSQERGEAMLAELLSLRRGGDEETYAKAPDP